LQFCVVMMQHRNLPSNVKRKPDTDVKIDTSKGDCAKNETSKYETSGIILAISIFYLNYSYSHQKLLKSNKILCYT